MGRDGAAQRRRHRGADSRRAVAAGRAMAAAHRHRYPRAARRRALLCERGPLLLSDLAAHAAGSGGVGAPRRPRPGAAALSAFRGARDEASCAACARARATADGGDDGGVVARPRRYGFRPISMAMTFGRCSMRGPADALTPAMMPSAISAAASACAGTARSLARLAATNTVTPEFGASGT